jgi:hypothetical protein
VIAVSEERKLCMFVRISSMFVLNTYFHYVLFNEILRRYDKLLLNLTAASQTVGRTYGT